MAKRKPLPTHWYRFHVGECPACGSDQSYRERKYTKKPRDRRKRYAYIPDNVAYDGCLG